jgi:AcrR family transcriptional regulator
MARPRLIPDQIVLDAILDVFLKSGDTGVSFRMIAANSGLSAAALVGRFGSGDAMLRAGLSHGWDGLMADLDRVADRPRKTGDGRVSAVQAVLKELRHPHTALVAASLARGDLAERAANWRALVVDLITTRTGAREEAEMIFAAWSARQVWDHAGGKGFRLGALLRRIN